MEQCWPHHGDLFSGDISWMTLVSMFHHEQSKVDMTSVVSRLSGTVSLKWFARIDTMVFSKWWLYIARTTSSKKAWLLATDIGSLFIRRHSCVIVCSSRSPGCPLKFICLVVWWNSINLRDRSFFLAFFVLLAFIGFAPRTSSLNEFVFILSAFT